MKIYDCFMFFDEEMLLDLRLNIMDQYVDKFVITEANYMHNGSSKKLNFNINNFSKFKDKIIYIPVEDPPPGLFDINKDDNHKTKSDKLILNGYMRDNYQREMAHKALKDIDNNDWIIINDIDEVPNLKNINFEEINNKLIVFKQDLFYYKFNLLYPSVPWFGSRACKKKDFISPQWLRNVKHRKYPLWRFDTIFSKNKYNNILSIDNGGWHFTNMMKPEDLQNKLLNYTHHHEFELSGITLNDLKDKMKKNKIIYDHSSDQREDKWNSSRTLEKASLSKMPDYIKDNVKKYSEWLEI